MKNRVKILYGILLTSGILALSSCGGDSVEKGYDSYLAAFTNTAASSKNYTYKKLSYWTSLNTADGEKNTNQKGYAIIKFNGEQFEQYSYDDDDSLILYQCYNFADDRIYWASAVSMDDITVHYQNYVTSKNSQIFCVENGFWNVLRMDYFSSEYCYGRLQNDGNGNYTAESITFPTDDDECMLMENFSITITNDFISNISFTSDGYDFIYEIYDLGSTTVVDIDTSTATPVIPVTPPNSK